MKTQIFAVLSSALVLFGCGQLDQEKKNSIEPSLPHAALVRVPVSSEGVEDVSKAELRLQKNSEAGASDVVSSFANAETVANVKSGEAELDQDSSNQSWFFRGYYGRPYHHGYGYGYRYYPSYYYGNRYYNYGYGHGYGYGYGYGYRPYYSGGYNYYYYPRWGC